MLLSNVNTHYSLLLGYAKPDELLKQCANREYKSCVLTDHNSLSGAVNFYKNAKKNKVKPIIGSRVTIINDKNQAFGQVNLYAKNKAGWFELIKLCSALYLNEEPSVTISQLRELKNVAAVLTGTGFISDEDSVYQIKDIFGKDFFVGFDTRNLKYGPNKSQLDLLKAIAEELNVYTLASPLVAYSNPEQKNDHLTLYSSHLGITSPEWAECADPNFAQFYNGDYSVPDKLDNLFSAGELNNLNRFNDLFEEYSILEKPSMPAFDCPNGMSEPDYLRQLCREGWTRKFGENPLSEHMKIKYGDRVKMELGVINKAGLDGYFLIVQDYVNWAKNQGWLIGPGRGSAGGCLVSYLTRITSIDPIKYDLLFERFYNEGRNTADHISFPDIDVDFPVGRRELVIDYIRGKYGQDYVSQVVTFSSLQGRGALKEVLRIHNVCDNKTMDLITKNIPQKDKISDRLEEDQEKSVIRWTLNNEPQVLGEWCTLNDKGEFNGPYAKYVEQAIKVESTFKSYGKHASALVISKEPMNQSCPMIREKNGGELIAAIEYTEMEELGKVKMDILGVAVLDKLMYINDLLMTGEINE